MLIVRAIDNYFRAIKDTWPEAWENKARNGQILNRTNGFRALMRLYGKLYREQGLPGAALSYESAKAYLTGLGVNDADFNIDVFPPGSSGESRLVKVLHGELTVEQIKAGQI